MKNLLCCAAAGLLLLAAGAQPPADASAAKAGEDPAGPSVAAEPAADSVAAAPQNGGRIEKYRRSSLYSVLMRHPDAAYGEAIDSAFRAIPIPDKFNDHDLGVKAFDVENAPRKRKGRERDDFNLQAIERFAAEHDVARGLVSKWFDRNPATGAFDMRLVQERGCYDASQLDIRLADQSALGRAVLADAGEQLIGKTFLLVNDITFVDRGEKTAKAGGWLRLLGGLAGAATGRDLSSVTDATARLVNEIDGFSVNITSYLFRLHWDEEVAAHFYTYYWMDGSSPDARRRAAFDTASLFRLEYVGKTTTSAGNLSTKSYSKSKEEQMLKVCTRAVDKSIVQLQRDYEEFKVNVPIYRINEDRTVDVQIGLKEGINVKSQFDVLMPVQDEEGRILYEKVGRIQPLEGAIWDNRFGADEEAAAAAADPGAKSGGRKNASDDEPLGNTQIDATTFRILSGANRIVPGCLVREVTIKRD